MVASAWNLKRIGVSDITESLPANRPADSPYQLPALGRGGGALEDILVLCRWHHEQYTQAQRCAFRLDERLLGSLYGECQVRNGGRGLITSIVSCLFGRCSATVFKWAIIVMPFRRLCVAWHSLYTAGPHRRSHSRVRCGFRRCALCENRRVHCPSTSGPTSKVQTRDFVNSTTRSTVSETLRRVPARAVRPRVLRSTSARRESCAARFRG